MQGNYIGTDVTGTLNRGNQSSDGIEIPVAATGNLIGGTAAGAGNLIAFNAANGVDIVNGTGNAVLGNQIYSNSLLGINLGAAGVTANDAGDPDAGANNLQNFPVLTSVNSNVAGTTIVGSLNSNANTTYRIEFYANRPAIADATNGEGERYLGFFTVTTNGAGNAAINTTLNNVWVNAGDRVTATATVDLGGGNYGNSSEFGANFTATSTGIVVVDTVNDVADGTTTSITNLGNARGADGRISLREAITAANNTGGTDTIVFNIAGAGPQTISVLSALPTITGTVILDATTQPGFVSTPLIEINGAGAGAGVNGLTVASTDSTIRGFVINRFSLSGIALTGDRNTVVGNFIGTNVAGTSALGNGIDGVEVFSNNNTIGGTTAAQRNIISGNLDDGINIDGTSGNVIQGNYIGTDVTGTLALGNQSDGVLFENGASNNTLGGTAASARNVIAFNADSGVDVITGTGNAFLGNSIHSNTSPGIDLNDDGVTINDLGDPDGGANALQNFPVLTSAVTNAATQIMIAGTLNSTASTSLRIEFFSNTAADPTGYGEGRTYLGFVNVTTDGIGNASFSTTLAGNVAVGASISATATRANGAFSSFFETSEFAQNIASTSNSPPVNTVPGAQSIPEDTTQAIAGISVSDPNNNVTTVALSVTNGILNVTLSGGATITAGANGWPR